ncbi:MAG: hypothetical protein FWE95_00250 [Planctomycetaceae bacterium]|nr:hypothetical protein [Planctomycetaceae bacterium]
MKRFGFAQFRFVVAGVLLIAAGLKAYQLATVPLPPVVQGSVFTPLLELLNDRYFQMAVVIGEILFALVLVAGIYLQYSWLLSILSFSVFTLVSLMKALSGETSCGCFGTVTVNPWITAAFDAVIVGLLVIFRERLDWTFPPLDRKKVLAVLVAWLVLAGPALFFMLSLQQRQAVLGTEYITADGKKVISLAPRMWIDKEFPLVSRFVEPEGSDILLTGTWHVVLISPNCSDCEQMMNRLEERMPENVVLVVVPSRRSEKVPPTPFPKFVLDRQNGWYAVTPVVVKLVDGICVEICRQIP